MRGFHLTAGWRRSRSRFRSRVIRFRDRERERDRERNHATESTPIIDAIDADLEIGAATRNPRSSQLARMRCSAASLRSLRLCGFIVRRGDDHGLMTPELEAGNGEGKGPSQRTRTRTRTRTRVIASGAGAGAGSKTTRKHAGKVLSARPARRRARTAGRYRSRTWAWTSSRE